MKRQNYLFGFLFIMAVMLSACEEDSSMDSGTLGPDNSLSGAMMSGTFMMYSAPVLSDLQISSTVLYAGQFTNAGTVTVSLTDTDADNEYDAFKVTYSLTGGWVFDPAKTEQVKFYVGTGTPTNNPGGYPYKATITDGSTTYTKVIPFSAFGFDGCTSVTLNIAAHADLANPTLNSTETGWGKGITEFGQGWGSYYNFTLSDKTPPTATNVVTLGIECLSDLPAVDPLVITDESDNCGVPTVTYKADSEVQTGSCPTTVNRTYIVTDAAGNSVEVTHTVIISDVTAPVLTWVENEGSTINNVCSTEGLWNTPLVSDNCDATIVPTFEDATTTQNGKVVSVTRTWSAVDACGNGATQLSQTITFDVTAPVLDFPGGELISALCGEDHLTKFTTPFAVGEPEIVPVQVVPDVTEEVGNTKRVTRSWTATDACGNSTTNSQTVVITCDPVTPPPGEFEEGAGTAWAFFGAPSLAFNNFTVSNNWGWTTPFTNSPDSYGVPQTATLYVGAGRNIISKGAAVGRITVTYTATNVNVKYEITPLCDITSVHIWVGATKLPTLKNKFVSSPGQFTTKVSPYTGITYEANIPNPGGSAFYLAAHADIIIK